MEFIMKIFGWPLGWIMYLCFMLVKNYGFALILFTIITKLMLFPLSLKQQKEQAKMAFFRPRMEAIQKKYGNNREKLNEEMQKLYTEEHYNPLSGCLPTLIQMPILFGLIDVIYRPLTHILRISGDVFEQIKAIAVSIGVDLTYGYTEQIKILNSVSSNPEAYSAIGSETLEKLLSLDMHFLGFDFTATPQFALTVDGAFNFLILIPILSGVTSLLMSLITKKMTGQSNGDANPQAKMMSNVLMLTMPAMSTYIAFIVPAGVGFYWLISNILMIGQSIFLNIKYNAQEMADKMTEELNRTKEEEKARRKEAKQRVMEGKATEEDLKAALSQKERDRRKLAEARRRDAEKYGEEYVEVTDEDLK